MKICRGSECLKVELVAFTCTLESAEGISGPEKVVAESAAISHAPEFREMKVERARKLINLLRELGHESVFEHAYFTFRVEGISRACSHQLVRHRMASYTQQSQRYVNLREPTFIIPDSIANSGFAGEYEELLKRAASLYARMVESGAVKKEDARFALPQAVETKIVITMNARSLRNFFRLRCAPDAQWEIRALAMAMLREAYRVAPMLFEDLYREYAVGND
jgi:thymidylate synthase (FAD)